VSCSIVNLANLDTSCPKNKHRGKSGIKRFQEDDSIINDFSTEVEEWESWEDTEYGSDTDSCGAASPPCGAASPPCGAASPPGPGGGPIVGKFWASSWDGGECGNKGGQGDTSVVNNCSTEGLQETEAWDSSDTEGCEPPDQGDGPLVGKFWASWEDNWEDEYEGYDSDSQWDDDYWYSEEAFVGKNHRRGLAEVGCNARAHSDRTSSRRTNW